MLKKLNEAEEIEAKVAQYELKFRQIVSEHSSPSLSKASPLMTRALKAKLEKLLLLRSSNKDYFYCILALLRLFMTENMVLSSNVNYLSNVLDEANFDCFLKNELRGKAIVSHHNIEYLDVITEILQKHLKFPSELVLSQVESTLKTLDSYLTQISDTSFSYIDSSRTWSFENKLCDMLEQIASNRIDSVFELSADMARLFFWAEECVSVKGECHSLLNNLRKYSELIVFRYKQCLTAKIVSKAKDEKYMLTKNEKPTTMLKSFILDNLRDRGNEVLQQSKNNYIDVVVAFIFSVNSISLPNTEPSPLVVRIVEKEYSKLLNLVTAISMENDLVRSWVEVLAYSTREDKFLDKLSHFYRRYSRINKQSDLEYVTFVSFLEKNKFIQHSSLRAETLRENAFLLVDRYLGESLSKDLKFNFYNESIKFLNKRCTRKSMDELCFKAFRNIVEHDPETALIYLADIETPNVLKSAADTLINKFVNKPQVGMILGVVVKNYKLSLELAKCIEEMISETSSDSHILYEAGILKKNSSTKLVGYYEYLIKIYLKTLNFDKLSVLLEGYEGKIKDLLSTDLIKNQEECLILLERRMELLSLALLAVKRTPESLKKRTVIKQITTYLAESKGAVDLLKRQIFDEKVKISILEGRNAIVKGVYPCFTSAIRMLKGDCSFAEKSEVLKVLATVESEEFAVRSEVVKELLGMDLRDVLVFLDSLLGIKRDIFIGETLVFA